MAIVSVASQVSTSMAITATVLPDKQAAPEMNGQQVVALAEVRRAATDPTVASAVHTVVVEVVAVQR